MAQTLYTSDVAFKKFKSAKFIRINTYLVSCKSLYTVHTSVIFKKNNQRILKY